MKLSGVGQVGTAHIERDNQMNDIEREVAELLSDGLCGMGVVDDWDEYIRFHLNDTDQEKTLKQAAKVARVIDWMNERLPEDQRVSSGAKFLEEAAEQIEELNKVKF
jgi:predicted urease superfamily metal-dependent hydrolase